MPKLQRQFNESATEFGWMSYYIPLFNIDVVTYLRPNFDAGLINLCQ